MRISNNIIRFGLVCGLAGSLHADGLILAGGAARLTGTVRSINEQGVVELASDLSPAPVLLKSGALRRVDFSADEEAPEPPSSLVELVNGDRLPVTIESLDEQKLIVTSPEAGRLEIPRESLASLQLGIKRRKVVYAGPRNLEEWSGGEDEIRNWVFERNSLVANGPATASRKFELPRQFILRFTLTWQAQQNPNFQVYFADPLKPKGEPCDRYYLRFSGAGLDIKREASQGKRHSDIQVFNRTPNQFPDRRLEVELRVDRKGSRLHLFLNGEPEGVFVDPVPNAPEGSGVVFVSTASNGTTQEVGNIEILEFDDSHGRHFAEERGDTKNDSLISREDDRWGGRLMEIQKTAEGSVFRFKSDFQNDPLEIPEADVSTVFFAVKDVAKPDDKVHPFVLRLRGDGSLRVASCGFTEDAASAVHPLLGRLNLRRDGIVAMERTDSEPKTDPEP